MQALVYITDTESGETRLHREEWAGEFAWGEGNNACDCCRSDYFRRASGEEDDPDITCGQARFAVRATDEAGALLYEDDPEICEYTRGFNAGIRFLCTEDDGGVMVPPTTHPQGKGG